MAGVGVDPDEVVTLSGLEEDVLAQPPRLLELELAAGPRLPVRHGQRQPDRKLRPHRADGLDRAAVRVYEHVGDAHPRPPVASAGREHAVLVAEQGDDVRLVDGDDQCREIAERLRHHGAVPGEPARRVGLFPCTGSDDPARVGEWCRVTTASIPCEAQHAAIER